MYASKASLSGLAIFMLVALRLVTGWHFYSEGVSKLQPDFSSAPFLRGAVGPLAPMYKQFAPLPHDANKYLARPREDWALTEDEKAANQKWQEERDARVREAEDADETPPVEFAPSTVYADWARKIAADWEALESRFADAAKLDEERRQRADAVLNKRLLQLEDYFESQNADLEEHQHEHWRLEVMREETDAGKLPYLDQRIVEKQAELNLAQQKWIRDVDSLESALTADLRALVDEKTLSDPDRREMISEAFNPSSSLSAINTVVTCVTIGAGVMLMFGFLTRVGAIAAVLFLLSVMATQPPWVIGANTTYFNYQLVEVFALLVLAAVGAGRWAGIDGLIWRLFQRGKCAAHPSKHAE